MRRTPLLATLFLFFLIAGASAKAQIGIYGEFSTVHTPAESFFGTTTAWYKGFTAGAYYDFLRVGPVKLGLDLRGGSVRANGDVSYNTLVGPRVALKLPTLPLRPYAQAVVGIGGIAANNSVNGTNTHYTGRLEYGAIGGLDYTVFPYLDLRLPEIGYLRTRVNQFSGPSAPINLITVSAGVVLRLP
jgi:hypothetical protein